LLAMTRLIKNIFLKQYLIKLTGNKKYPII